MFCRLRLTRAFFALLLPLAVLGCGTRAEPPAQSGSSASNAAPKAAVSQVSMPRDDLGRDLGLSAPARRVIVIGPGAVETIFALGAGEKIIGRDTSADFPREIKKVPAVADYRGPFIEACVAARPDLILLQGETWNRERVENWQKKIGAPVAALTPTTVEQVQKDADKIAAWLGVGQSEMHLAPTYSGFIMSGKTAFIEISRSPLWTAGKGTLVSDVVEKGQFRNAAGDVTGYKAFSKEALVARQPDFYITTGKAQERERIIASLKADATLGALKCVREGRIIVLPSDHLLRPGPRLREGVLALHKVRAAAHNRERDEANASLR